MRFAIFNTMVALTLLLGSAVTYAARQEQNQPPAQPPADSQSQSEPAQPSQAQPEQTPIPESPQTQTPPEEGAQPPAPQTQAPQEPSATPKKATTPSAKPKSTKKKKSTTKTQAGTQSGKVVVTNGGAKEGPSQLSPGMSDEQAQHQRETTTQLLATTDANLKKMSGKQLTPAQQSLLGQINSYVRQSKSASDSGDVSRAHTLAFKAHLLSNELARK